MNDKDKESKIQVKMPLMMIQKNEDTEDGGKMDEGVKIDGEETKNKIKKPLFGNVGAKCVYVNECIVVF